MMTNNSVRALLASDRPAIRRYFQKLVEDQLEGVIVGESENAHTAVSLARQLRPDLVIVDCCLPYYARLVDITLSANAGLDAAQAIRDEIPDVRVILVDTAKAGTDEPVSAEDYRLSPAIFTGPEEKPGLSFASLQRRPSPLHKMGFSDICLAIGGGGLVLGLALTTTMVLAFIGLPLVLIGVLGIFAGCLGKVFSASSVELKPEIPGAEGNIFAYEGRLKEPRDAK